jgi:hypothetical protein
VISSQLRVTRGSWHHCEIIHPSLSPDLQETIQKMAGIQANNGSSSTNISVHDNTPAAPVTPRSDNQQLTSPRDPWVYDLESLEGYNRLKSPGHDGDGDRRNIQLDTDGFISGEHGLPVLSVLMGAVRMPQTSSKMITLQERGAKLDAWEFPGWGQTYVTVMDSTKLQEEHQHKHKHQLDLFRSTAIAGNDLLASVLYTTGICATACGQMAPFVVAMGIVALYPFRKIFQVR